MLVRTARRATESTRTGSLGSQHGAERGRVAKRRAGALQSVDQLVDTGDRTSAAGTEQTTAQVHQLSVHEPLGQVQSAPRVLPRAVLALPQERVGGRCTLQPPVIPASVAEQNEVYAPDQDLLEKRCRHPDPAEDHDLSYPRKCQALHELLSALEPETIASAAQQPALFIDVHSGRSRMSARLCAGRRALREQLAGTGRRSQTERRCTSPG